MSKTEPLPMEPGKIHGVRIDSWHVFYSLTCGACQDEALHLDSPHTVEIRSRGWYWHPDLGWICPGCAVFVLSLPQEELPF